MAGTYTHFKFMKDLEKKISFNKDKDLFLVAGQGHDLLFFIKLRELKCFGKRNEIVRTIASCNFRDLVIKWQEEIIDTNDEDLEILLYGYIAHHVLDSYIHPWLNNKCNCYFDKLDKNTWENNGRHETLESMLDYLVLNPYEFKMPKIKLKKRTKDSLNNLFKDIYELEDVGSMMLQGVNNMQGFISLYRLDRLGIKKLGYMIIDFLTAKNARKFTFLSFHYSKTMQKEVQDKYLRDFNKLYSAALSEASILILEIMASLENKKVLMITYDKSAT